MKTLYEILEVSENASIEVIEKAYKVLAKKYHPDLQQTLNEKSITESKMKEINEAYSILSNVEKRENYDIELKNRRNQENRNNVDYNNLSQGKSNNDINKKLKKKQKKLENKLKRKMQDPYLKEYGDYLRKNGYRVKYRIDLKKIPQLMLIISILIVIVWIIWTLPVTHTYLVKLYEQNIIVQKLISLFFK